VRKPLADELYRALRVAGLRVWMDELEMGHDLAASMSDGIAKSDVVVMLVSPTYAASGPCMFEARATAAAGKPLVTCCVEPGFWRSWLAADGSGAPALPDSHELVTLARLKTHLFVDFGVASAVNWTDESLAPAERKKLTLPEALPRLLALVEAARASAGSASAPPPPLLRKASPQASASGAPEASAASLRTTYPPQAAATGMPPSEASLPLPPPPPQAAELVLRQPKSSDVVV